MFPSVGISVQDADGKSSTQTYTMRIREAVFDDFHRVALESLQGPGIPDAHQSFPMAVKNSFRLPVGIRT
jgi:hypothetical protein